MAIADYTIEDCLEMLMGFSMSQGSDFKADPSDAAVLHSIAKQIIKGTALTDRQYELLSEKMSQGYYVAQFAASGLAPADYRHCLERTRRPLRQINRTKYIKLVDNVPEEYHTRRGRFDIAPSNVPWMEIAFPFSKNVIAIIDNIAKKTNSYVHLPGERCHYFKCEENIVYELVSEFKNKEFVVDNELLEYFERLEYLELHKYRFIPRIREGALENVHPETEKYLLEKLGTPSVDNVVNYLDKSLLFDIRCIDIEMRKKALERVLPLTSKIVHRTSPWILVKPREWFIDEIIASLLELKRFPLLVVVSPEDALHDLKEIHSLLKDKLNPGELSVLFRLDNDTNAKFNDYVKEQNLNAPVSDTTQVVVISKDKLPKPMLKAGWYPECVLRMGSNRAQTKIDQWIYDCDLVIHYDAVATQWQASHVKRRTVETI